MKPEQKNAAASKEPSASLLERAMKPRLEFGRGLLCAHSESWGEALVVTMPQVWEQAKPLLSELPAHLHFVDSMDRTQVEGVFETLPEAESIIGIGGGMSLDMAKYAAWRRGLDPLLAPSIASVDACVTNTIAVREEGRVRYIGFVVPKAVIVDFELMQKAPANLNRAGIGDLLSIHTGCFDWELAAKKGEVKFEPAAADRARALVSELELMAPEINQVTEKALRWMIEAYALENELCLQVAHSRPEEGSEHFFAYNLERRVRKNFVHGELVCLGALIMSRLQENEPERVERILAAAGVQYQPAALGLLREEVEGALLTLSEYVEEEGLFHSIVNERAITRELMEPLLAGLEFGGGGD